MSGLQAGAVPFSLMDDRTWGRWLLSQILEADSLASDIDLSGVNYRQSAAPASPAAGHTWYDTDDGLYYRYSGSTWEQIAADDPLLSSFNAAAEAGADVTSANADDISFRQATAPVSPVVGWLWYDTDDGLYYRFNGSIWQQIAADDPLLASFNAVAEAGANVTESRLRSGLIVNGSFETGTTEGWAAAPSEWEVVNDATLAITGSYLARISSGSTGARSDPFVIEAGERVLVTLQAQRDPASLPDADLSLSVRWEQADGTFISSTVVDSAAFGTSGLQALQGVVTAPTNTKKAKVIAFKLTGSTGRWYADDVTANLVLRDSDIDALSTTNAPAEAGADVTANQAATIIFRQSTAPSSPQAGWIWQDTDDSIIYRYQASWVQIGADDALLITSNAPAEPSADVTTENLVLKGDSDTHPAVGRNDTNQTSSNPSTYQVLHTFSPDFTGSFRVLARMRHQETPDLGAGSWRVRRNATTVVYGPAAINGSTAYTDHFSTEISISATSDSFTIEAISGTRTAGDGIAVVEIDYSEARARFDHMTYS